MAIGTRDYARPYLTNQGSLPWGIKWLLISNVAVVVLPILYPPAAAYILYNFGLVPKLAVEHLYIWQFATYMFVHGSATHILFNLLALWMFGTELEQTWGTQRFLRFYFVCGVGAGVVVTITNYITGTTTIPTIGCSAAVYGILMAWAVLWPDRIILFMFLFPMKVRVMVIIYAAIAFLSALGNNSNVSNVGHLSGMAFAYVFLKIPRTRRRGAGAQPLDRLRHSYQQWKMARAKKKFQVYLNKHRSGRGPYVN
jgi:membrane associated rhomboid family serine protease